MSVSSGKTAGPPNGLQQPSSHMGPQQIVGVVLICVFLCVYIFFIISMYKGSSEESKDKLKDQMRQFSRRVSMAATDSARTKPDPKRRRSSSQTNINGKERAKSIVETMVIAEPEVTSILHENRFIEPEVPAPDTPPPPTEQNQSEIATRPSDQTIITKEKLKEIDQLLLSPPLQGLPATSPVSLIGSGAESLANVRAVLTASPPDEDSAGNNSSARIGNVVAVDVLPSPTNSVDSLDLRITPPTPTAATTPTPTAAPKISTSGVTHVPHLPPLKTPRSQGLIHCKALADLTPESGSRIASLDLSNQELKIEQITIIAKLLATQTCSMLSLILRTCGLRDFEAAVLGRALLRNNSLTRMDISANKITEAGCAVIAAAFGTVETLPPTTPVPSITKGGNKRAKTLNTTLQELIMTGNRIGSTGAEHLTNALQHNATLTVLDVSYQRKSFKIGPAGAHKFSQWIGNTSCKLLTFKCARNNIGFEGCRHLSSALLRNRTITDVDIGGVNYITVAGALQLGQAIKANAHSKLTWLTVGEHRIPVQSLSGAVPNPRGTIIRIYRNEGEDDITYRDKAFVATTRHGMDDELAVVVATLVMHNETLETLQVEEAQLPIQKLIGNDCVEFLDLSNQHLTSIDAIIIGSLIAENSHLKLINLKGNCFGGTEGENFVAYALERNTALKLDTLSWPVEQMFSDGYPALAAALGMSASGVQIEPQRLEGWFYQGLTVWSAILFYVGLVFDIVTLYTFSINRKVYFAEWVVLLTLIMCTPTVVYLFNTLRNLLVVRPEQALKQALIIILQASPAILAYEAVLASMESAALLDFKFVQATHKSIPQVYFQCYIMFAVGMYTGEVNFWSLVSVLSTLISITVIFIMLFDRKAARRMAMAPLCDQPTSAVLVARLFEVFGMGTTTKEVQAFVNFDAFYTAHYTLSYIYQIAGLCPRIISVAWLLACENAVYGVITLLVSFSVRVLVLCLHDAETFNRSYFNNTILAISLVISDSAWKLSSDVHNEEAEKLSRDSFINLSFLSTAEIFIALYYPYFVFNFTLISVTWSTTLFITMIVFIGIRWWMTFEWALHVHFPRLYLTNSRVNGSVEMELEENYGSVMNSDSVSNFSSDTAPGGIGGEVGKVVQYAFGWNPFHKNHPGKKQRNGIGANKKGKQPGSGNYSQL